MSRTVLAVLAAGLLFAALPTPAAAQAGPYQYHSLTPCRVFDTRVTSGDTAGSPPLANGTTRTFVVQGKCSVPVGAKAVSVNVTALSPVGGGGYLTLFPTGITRPVVSSLNFNPGEPAVGNGGLVPLADQTTHAQDLSIYTKVGTLSTNTVHAVLDVTGYFQ